MEGRTHNKELQSSISCLNIFRHPFPLETFLKLFIWYFDMTFHIYESASFRLHSRFICHLKEINYFQLITSLLNIEIARSEELRTSAISLFMPL